MSAREDIGRQLRERRAALGLTVDDVAARAGYCPRQVRRALAGRHASIETLDAVAEAMGLRVGLVLR